MRTLDRQLLREVREHRGQVISIALVVAAGVMSVITMRSTFRSLEASQASYYREYRFADIFASLERAPEALAGRIAAIPGVAAVETRVQRDVVLSVPGLEQAASGRILSIPGVRRPMLNDLHLRQGRWIAPDRTDEVILSERFATANAFRTGDTLSAVINGRQRTLDIVGIAISPEFVYEVAGTAGFFADERLFGVIWMGRDALAAASEMEGAFNDVSLRLAPSASEREVLNRLDALLDPYGGFGAVGRSDQISHRILSDEIKQNRVTATVVPFVFLGVAAFLLHIVMLRMVATQRTQIALLKAFGYTDRDVALHYLAFALIAVGAGAVLGIVAGTWLGRAYVDVYSQYFLFPSLDYVSSPALAAAAIAVSGTAALAGAFAAVREALRLQPAVGMRADAPATFRPLLIERFGLHRLLSAAQRMIIRNVERRPVRALLSATGIGFALATLLIGMVLLDSLREMMTIQFRTVQREDMAVAFNEARPDRALREIARIPGVVRAEPYRVTSAELSHGPVSRRLGLTGLDPDGVLRPMVDQHQNRHALPVGGVVLTERVARTLRVRPGDTIDVELLERGSERRRVAVAALVNEMIGINGYMALPELNALLREGPAVSGVYLSVARGADEGVFTRLSELPGVASATSKTAMVRSFEDQLAESLYISLIIVVTLAAILAIGVIYNGARIALSERGRELASLRVLGFTRREVASMLLGEQAVVTGAGLPIGALLGLALVNAIIQAFDTDLYRMPLAIRWETFAICGAIVAGIAAGAGLLVRRKLDRADLISVLKTRE